MTTNDIEMRVDIDIAQAKAELESLKRSVEGFVNDLKQQENFNFKLTLDIKQAQKDLAYFKDLANNNFAIVIDVNVKAAANLISISDAVNKLTASVIAGAPALDAYSNALDRLHDSASKAGGELDKIKDKEVRPQINTTKIISGINFATTEIVGSIAKISGAAAAATLVVDHFYESLVSTTNWSAYALGVSVGAARTLMLSKELETLIYNTGLSAQALRTWQLAGGEIGVKAEDVSKAFEGVADTLADIRTNGSEAGAAETLARIGVSLESVRNLNAEQFLKAVVTQLDSIAGLSQIQRNQLLEGIAAGAGALSPLLKDNADKLERIRLHAASVGAIINPEQQQSAKLANQALSEMRVTLEGLSLTAGGVGANIINQFAPSIKAFLDDEAKDLIAWSKGAQAEIERLHAVFVNAGGFTDYAGFKALIKDIFPELYRYSVIAYDGIMGFIDGVKLVSNTVASVLRPVISVFESISSESISTAKAVGLALGVFGTAALSIAAFNAAIGVSVGIIKPLISLSSGLIAVLTGTATAGSAAAIAARGLSVALGLLTSPIGLLVAGLGAAAYWIYQNRDAQDELISKVKLSSGEYVTHADIIGKARELHAQYKTATDETKKSIEQQTLALQQDTKAQADNIRMMIESEKQKLANAKTVLESQPQYSVDGEDLGTAEANAKVIEAYNYKILLLNKELDRLSTTEKTVSSIHKDLGNNTISTTASIAGLNAGIIDLAPHVDALSNNFLGLANAERVAVEVNTDHANIVKSAIEALEKQRIAIQLGDRAAQYYTDRLKGLTDAEARAKASAEQYNDILGIRKQLDLDARGIGAGLATKFKLELEAKGVSEAALQFGTVKTQADIAVSAQDHFNKLVKDARDEIEKMGQAYQATANNVKTSTQAMAQSVTGVTVDLSSKLSGSISASSKTIRDMQANAQQYSKAISAINSVSASSGVDATTMKTMAWIESRFNYGASRGAGGAKGLYQFVPGTAAQYGINGQELNVEANTRAYVKLLQDNMRALQKYGLEINGANLYLAHQQGAGGLKQIMDAAAGRGRMSAEVASNMRNNLLPGVGNDPSAFLDSWRKKYAEIELGVKQVFGAVNQVTDATQQAANASSKLDAGVKTSAASTAKIIPFWDTIKEKTQNSNDKVVEFGRAIQGANISAGELQASLIDKRMNNEMLALVVNASKAAAALKNTGYEIRNNELLQLDFNKAQAQAILAAESNLAYLQEERKMRLEMALVKAGSGMAATYRAGLNDKPLSDDQKNKLTGQNTNLQYEKLAEDNRNQILQLRLTEQAYQRIKLAKDGYTKAQITGLAAQQKEIALLQAARDAGYRGADSFKNAIQVKAIAATGFLQNMVGGVANANKTMFEINKAASIANALLNAKESVVGAYKFGAAIGGPWLGATFGAIAAAAQAANVASIASQSFGGGSVGSAGGSASSGANGVGTGSGTSSGSTTDKPKDPPTVTIALSGNDNTQYSKKQVRELIKQINDAVGDGARLRVA